MTYYLYLDVYPRQFNTLGMKEPKHLEYEFEENYCFKTSKGWLYIDVREGKHVGVAAYLQECPQYRQQAWNNERYLLHPNVVDCPFNKIMRLNEDFDVYIKVMTTKKTIH